MMFDYDVLTEQEAMSERYQLLPDGDYDALIQSSVDKLSENSGNPMLDMLLTVYDTNGKDYPVREFLTLTRNTMWKVIHCAESAGLLQEYKDKKFCSDIVRGKMVRVRIITEKGGEIPAHKLNGKPPGTCYRDKNKVVDYLVKKESQTHVIKDDPFFDDSVPF